MEVNPQEQRMVWPQKIVRPAPAETERMGKVKTPWMTVAERENMGVTVVYE
jgi:hypothetical protein